MEQELEQCLALLLTMIWKFEQLEKRHQKEIKEIHRIYESMSIFKPTHILDCSLCGKFSVHNNLVWCAGQLICRECCEQA